MYFRRALPVPNADHAAQNLASHYGSIAIVRAETLPRRTQEDRRAKTRDAILRATVSALAEHGYASVRTRHIIERAGVTWGAVQHLFGDKEGLYLDVATHAIRSLTLEIHAISKSTDQLEERIDRVTKRTWANYSSASYLAMTEVVRGSRGDEAFQAKVIETQKTWTNHVAKGWRELFAAYEIDHARIDEARNMVTLILSGLASRQLFLLSKQTEKEALKHAKSIAMQILKSSS